MFDAFFLRKFRRIHPRHIGYRSPLSGYAAVADESRHEHEHLDDAQLRTAVHGTFTDLMGGRAVTRAIGGLGRRAPRATARTLTRAIPHLFRWLVGPVERTGPTTLHIPTCRFLTETSPQICLRVCRKPTEDFFTDTLHVATRLTPDHRTSSCLITLGPSTEGREQLP